MALRHKELNEGLKNDIMRDEYYRRYSEGLCDACAYVVQMFDHSDTIGITDYKNIFKMKKAERDERRR
jgi:hypothetical protein